MLDAVQSAAEHLRARPNARRVLLLISESRDRGSETALDQAAIAAQKADVTIYAVTYSAFKTAFTSKLPVSEPRRPIKHVRPNVFRNYVTFVKDGMDRRNACPTTKWNSIAFPRNPI